jgi:hypothetical protein
MEQVKWNKHTTGFQQGTHSTVFYTCPERINQAEEIAYDSWSLHCVKKKKKDCIAFISDLRLNLSTRAGLRPDTNELLRASRLYITVVHEAA